LRQTLRADDFNLSNVDIYINSRCNRRCAYCFLPDEFFATRQQISIEVADAIISWCQGAIREVTLLGGEPSLHPRIADIAELVASSGLNLRVVTNGSPPFRKLLNHRSFIRCLRSVAVSLDHFEADAACTLRGRGAFDDAMHTIRRLTQLNVPVAVNCTVTSLLADRVSEMIGFVEKLGAFRLNLHWLSSVGRARARPDLVVSTERWRAVLDTLIEYRPARPDYEVDCEVGWIYPDLKDLVDPFECAVRARTNLQFMPDGRVFSCGLLVESEQLHGYEWRDGVLHSRIHSQTEVVIADDAACSTCPIRNALNEYQTGDNRELSPACIYQRARPRGFKATQYK
jgi:MoaA/NifB/PqqE/SkfB family radical SAM enzyme